MRIIGGAWRGRALAAPPGARTRPTADRVRQALFDSLAHAPWAGPDALRDAEVLDAFAGTGAFGLEALSRGAHAARFLERDPAALRAIRANVASCGAAGRARVIAADVFDPPAADRPATLAFLDPPYGTDASRAVARLRDGGWLVAGTLLVVETARFGDPGAPVDAAPLATRTHGAATLNVFRLP